MKFIKWFIKENPFHIVIFLLGYLTMFIIWGEDGADDRQLAIPIWTFILLVLVLGKYRQWNKVDKNYNN
jgi:membrane protein DedA with SNARE-associated domain